MIALLSLTTPTWACGGLVCSAGPIEAQVVQNAERIAFHVDEDAGMVEAHVQVFYDGPPDQFGWVVPVSGDPEVFLSTDALFQQVGTALAPTVRLDTRIEGNCRSGSRMSLGCTEYSMASSPSDVDFADTGGIGDPVQVVSEGQAGPYDFQVLAASDGAALVGWMQEAGYAVPDTLEGLLQPYLSDQARFLAVRLSKDRDSGDIAPLGWRYPGETASIPIQLTALASAPDLRLEVSVFGNRRAVPESYLHVTINDAQLDWFGGGQNYYDVVARAADQAGGHAFATDFAGDTAALRGTLWSADRESLLADLQLADDPAAFADALAMLALPMNANLRAALSGHLQQVPEEFVRPTDLEGVDLQALRDDLELFVFQPLRDAEALFEASWVTRLSSSLDADEMTVDPTFVLNGDIVQTVDNLHAATLVTVCDGGSAFESPRRIELADGRVYSMPAASETPDPSGWWLEHASDVEAILIERTGKNGQAEVVSDLRDEAWSEVGDPKRGCGCSQRTAPFTGTLLGILGVAFARRRSTCGS